VSRVKPKPSLDEVIEELRRLRVRDSDRDRDRESFLHEISVYQEELLAQNEALAGARAVLEEARDRYIELYDFAPNGYLTLDQNGVIRECNLTSATMFGHSKPRLIDAPLLGFIHSSFSGAAARGSPRTWKWSCRSSRPRGGAPCSSSPDAASPLRATPSI
jgi:PAS domain-containing protein